MQILSFEKSPKNLQKKQNQLHLPCTFISYRCSMIKAILFDLDDTLYDYEAAHQVALKKVFTKIAKATGKSVEMLRIVYEISQKEIKRLLIGTAASHNRDLYFQRFFEYLNQEMKHKIVPHKIINCYEYYRKNFYQAMKQEKATSQMLKYLKKKKIKT